MVPNYSIVTLVYCYADPPTLKRAAEIFPFFLLHLLVIIALPRSRHGEYFFSK
jgi:hypothetical protein